MTRLNRLEAIRTGVEINQDYKNYLFRQVKREIFLGKAKDTGAFVGRMCPLFSTADKSTFFAVKRPVSLEDLKDSCIIHFINKVEYKTLHKLGSLKIPVQTFVWKSPLADKYHMAGIAKDVLINFLLKKYKIVGSDSSQSPDGERFWRGLVDSALTEYGSTSIYIYLYDARFSTYLQLPRITHTDELDALSVWGKTPEFSKTRLLISLKPIEI